MKGQSATPTPVQQFLSFSLNPDRQALLSAQHLAEIIRLDPSKIIGIPQMPSAVIGVFPWQGEVLWLVDLAYLFCGERMIKSVEIPSSRSILKVRSQQGNLGLLVAQIGKLVSCEPDRLHPWEQKNLSSPRVANSQQRENSVTVFQNLCIQSSWTHPDGRILPIINIEALIRYINPESAINND